MKNNRPRIIVFAYSEPGWSCLKALIESHANIVAVYTHQDAPDEHIWFHSVYDLAQQHHLPVFRPAKIDAAETKRIMDFKPELIFSFYYRRLIPDIVIKLPRLGSFNLHGALLPKYRGQTCINWAVINGESKTGATLHAMTDKPDAGGIVDQRSIDIAFDDTALDVFKKISCLAAQMIKDDLPQLENGTAVLKPQDDSQATKYPRRHPSDGLIDFKCDAVSIYNLIRGTTHPFPGAFTYLHGQKLFIWKALPLNTDDKAVPGTVISTKPLLIAMGKGALKILSLQLDGQPEQKAADFAASLSGAVLSSDFK